MRVVNLADQRDRRWTLTIILPVPVLNAGMKLLIPLLLLMACNGPSPQFRNIEASRVVIDGSVFDVRVKGRRAEAVRINRQYAPRMGVVGVKAGLAIEAVSGCRVKRIEGDQAMIRASLACGGDSPLQKTDESPKISM